jgi:HAMP domain-containing protein
MFSTIKKRLSLKISITLALVMLLLIVPVAMLIINSQINSMEELTLEKAKVAANNGAAMYGMVLENAVESGLLMISEVFDVDYQLIKGYNWGKHPKYHTKYDFYTDKATIVFLDSMLLNPDFVFAVGQDINGYIPTHNTQYQKPITGVPAKDLIGNRTKRFFKDPVGQKASQNEKPGLKQIYKRDTGVTMWDVSSPIYVKGKHWGGFRIGVSIERIENKKSNMILLLLGLFGLFAVLVTITIFVMIRQAIKPIESLTASAKEISLGRGLDNKIKANTGDEIGDLTKAVDRLRASMKAAMERLGE